MQSFLFVAMYIRFWMYRIFKSCVKKQMLLLSALSALLLCSIGNAIFAQQKAKFIESTLELCSNKAIASPFTSIEVVDHRYYDGEIGKLLSFEKNKWIKLKLKTPFSETFSFLQDSLSKQLNITHPLLIRIQSFYIQENKMKGTSMRYARVHYRAEYFVKNKNQYYELAYIADSSHLVQSYLLEISLATEVKQILHHHLIRLKNSGLRKEALSREQALKTNKLVEQNVDLFSESKHDGVFRTWEQFAKLEPELSSAKIKTVSKTGQLQFADTLTKNKQSVSLFSLYAFLRQGIFYKCTRYGAFTLLNIQNEYFYVGMHEAFFTQKPDAYQYKKLSKSGGAPITQDDLETQKYLFRIDSKTGLSTVVCSITPADDYTNILMNLKIK